MRKCENHHYTLEEECACGKKTAEVHPPPFSLDKEIKWGKWRRAAGKSSQAESLSY